MQLRHGSRAASFIPRSGRFGLRLLAEGRSNEQIAEQLHLQVQSVKNTLRSVYGKLGVRNRGDALLYYWDIWREW